MGSSSMDSWDDFLSGFWGLNLSYLHSKGVKKAPKVRWVAPYGATPCNFAIWGPRDPKFDIILVFSIKSPDIKFQVSTTSVRQVRAGPVLAVATWRARPKRPYVLGCNFCSSWNFDMGSSSMDSWDDSLSRCVGSNLTYLHSKGVKNARKHNLSKILSVINGPWRQWWRHDDVIE